MAASLTTLEDLREAGLIDADRTEALRAVAGRYAIAVTPAVAALIDSADPADPIARQYVPTADELSRLPEERDDPIGDGPHSPVPGIVHRYPDRVLLKAVHVCPVYCRFCFRREMVGPSGDGTNLAGWDEDTDPAHGDAVRAATLDANARRLLRLDR